MAVESVGVGVQRVVAPYRQRVGRLPPLMVVTVSEPLRAIDVHDVAAGDEHGRAYARHVAGVSREREARVVRAAVGCGQPNDGLDVAARASCEDDRLGAVFFLYSVELFGDELVRLIPADALPFVLLTAELAGALHGMQQAVGVLQNLGQVQAAHAQAALVERVLQVAFDLHELAVLVRVHQHAAAVVAAGSGPRRTAGDGQVPLPPLAGQRALFVVDIA